MKIRRYRFIFAVVLLLIGFDWAFAAGAQNLKALYKISDSEIAGILNKVKASDPATYQAYMQIKKTDPAQYEQAVCSAVLQGRIKSNTGISAQLQKAQLNQTKVMFGITNIEIANFLDKLSNADPASYNYFMRLKKENPSMYEESLLARIIQHRKTGSFSLSASEAGNEPQFAALQQVTASIQDARQQWLNAQSGADKERARSNLRALLVKNYALSTQLLTTQAEKAEEQVRALKERISDRLRDKERAIDASLTQMTE